jgi:hypothetical protein
MLGMKGAKLDIAKWKRSTECAPANQSGRPYMISVINVQHAAEAAGLF